jgi:hypothetical protein
LVKLAMSSKYLKTVPLPHQLETVGTVLSTKYIGDMSEMGTGKSLSFLAAFCEILEKDPFAVALVVCPPYLVNNWLAEVAKHTTLKASPHFKEPALDAHIHIIPYTQLAKVEKIFRMATIIGTDEGHYLKNLGAKRTMLFHNFFQQVPAGILRLHDRHPDQEPGPRGLQFPHALGRGSEPPEDHGQLQVLLHVLLPVHHRPGKPRSAPNSRA